MMKQLFTALFAVTLIFAFSTVTFAQDKDPAKATSEVKMKMKEGEMQKDKMMQKKDEMMKDKAMSGLKSLSCDPACGFKVVSKDEAEIVSMTKMHAKTHHPDMTMTDAQIKGMVKPVMMHEKNMDKMMDKKMDGKMNKEKPDGL